MIKVWPSILNGRSRFDLHNMRYKTHQNDAPPSAMSPEIKIIVWDSPIRKKLKKQVGFIKPDGLVG